MNQAELYAENNSCTYKGSCYMVNKYRHLLKWKRNPSILEIGVGDGNTTEKVLLAMLPEEVEKLVGIDVSKNMIDYAKRNRNLEKMSLRTLDISTNKLPDDLVMSFDHVLSFYTMHWVREIDQAFKNISDMLKPGGNVFIVFFAEVPFDKAFEKLSKNPKWTKYGSEKWISIYSLYNYTMETYRKKLENEGFTDIFIQPESYVHPFTDQAEWIRLMLTLNPTIDEVPMKEREEYIKDYIAYLKEGEYVSHGRDENGGVVLRYQQDLVVLYAKKP